MFQFFFLCPGLVILEVFPLLYYIAWFGNLYRTSEIVISLVLCNISMVLKEARYQQNFRYALFEPTFLFCP